jgi:hypothetical protein
MDGLLIEELIFSVGNSDQIGLVERTVPAAFVKKRIAQVFSRGNGRPATKTGRPLINRCPSKLSGCAYSNGSLVKVP